MNENMTPRIQENPDEVTIDLGEVFMVLWRNKILLFAAMAAAALVAFAGTKFLITPKYTSDTTLYVKASSSGTNAMTNADMQTATQLTTDYVQLVTSRTVMEEVIDQLDLDTTTEQLADQITVSNPTNTRFLVINVEDKDPAEAKAVADATRESVSGQIVRVMGSDTVNVVDTANMPEEPSSPSLKKNTLIGALIGLLLAAAILIVRMLLDDTIKTPDDVTTYLGMNVLASVPESSSTSEKRNRMKNARKGGKRK